MAGRVIQGYFPDGRMRPMPGAISPPPPAPGPPRRAAEPPRPAVPSMRAVQPAGGAGMVDIAPVHLGLAHGGGKPLPAPLLAKMEAAFGAIFPRCACMSGR